MRASQRSLTTAQFIEKARAKHGTTYDYSKAVYLTSKDKIAIICPEHGLFMQNPDNHRAGAGCPKCGVLRRVKDRRLTQAEFLAKAKEKHGDKYDYSQAEFVSTNSMLVIICPEHGPFTQGAVPHLYVGCGCPSCSRRRMGLVGRVTTETFIARATAKHGASYDYSSVQYSGIFNKVVIGCPVHGVFEQPACNHLGGAGCPKCGRARTDAASRLEWIEQARGRRAELYFLRFYSDGEEFYKVGITVNGIRRRFGSKAVRSGYEYEVLAVYASTNAAAVYDWEQSIIETFAHLQYFPKRPFAGATECFSSANEILAVFPL